MNKHRVVIVGGGFAGVKAALVLADDQRFSVTLVSDKVNFQYYPTLYKTAAGASRAIASMPLEEVFAGKNIQLLHDRLIDIDRQAKTISTEVNHTIGYESLLLCLGVKTNYFGIKGLEEFSYGIKSLEDAQAFKNHLHRQLIDEKHTDTNYVVVGGGPTGVELAAALPGYIRKICRQHGLKKPRIHIDLVEAAPRVMPRMSKRYSRRVTWQLRRLGIKVRTHASVQAQSADALMVDNKPIRSHTVVWTAGVTNHPFFKEHGFQLATNGRVRVNQFLQAEPNIYVLGDNADTPYSGMAQTALYDGKFVSENLRRQQDNQALKPYNAKMPVTVVPVGPLWAAFDWRGLRIYGLLGHLLRSLADLVAYHDYEPWKIAANRWMKSDDQEETCPLCADALSRSAYLSGEV